MGLWALCFMSAILGPCCLLLLHLMLLLSRSIPILPCCSLLVLFLLPGHNTQQKDLRWKGLLGTTLECSSLSQWGGHGGRGMGQLVMLHLVSGSERDECSHFLLFLSRASGHGMVPLIVSAILPSSVNLIWTLDFLIPVSRGLSSRWFLTMWSWKSM